MHTAIAAAAVHWHDVRMIELGCRQRLLLEPRQGPRIESGRERKHFQGHPPVERDLPCFVDDPHPPPADFMQNLVIANRSQAPGTRCRLCRAALSTRQPTIPAPP